MRIAHVLSHVSEVHAGVPIATAKLCRALVCLGLEVSVWATGSPEEGAALERHGINPHLFPRVWPRGWRRSPEFASEFERRIGDYDVIHIHEVWNYPQLAAAAIASRHHIPFIWAPRASLEPWRMKYKGWKKSLYFKLLGKRIMASSTCMHAVSAGETEGFRRLGFQGPTVVVNNGIDPGEFDNLPDPAEADLQWPTLKGKRVVLFMSRISPEKGIDCLIRAWEGITGGNDHPDAFLVLAGPDDRGYRDYVEKELGRRNLTNQVIMPGMVSGRDKLALISRSQIFVLPSFSEGFSNSILESLACAKPVLITPGCNFPEVVSIGAGVSVKPDSDLLEDALEQLLIKSKEELEDMGQRGRSLILENYTWEISARKLVSVYNAIIKGKPVPENPEPISIGLDGRALFQ
ncbi:MAG: glycosyltransferase [Geobacteraceae bacterium]|nr:glycosyltransferase [Geobacteraceae bacterium]